MSEPADRVVVATVVKPHGIRGEVACALTTDVADRLAPGTPVWVGGVATTVAASRPHQGKLLVRFEHVADRTQAERLRGAEVAAAPLSPQAAETYFVHELVGMRVLDDGGQLLGTVAAWVELPEAAGYDLLEVAPGDGSARWLLPAVDDYVEVDADEEGEHLVVVDPPEGLLPEAGD